METGTFEVIEETRAPDPILCDTALRLLMLDNLTRIRESLENHSEEKL